MFTLIQGSAVVEFVGRIALLPLVGGISYEIIKLSGKHLDNPLVKIIIAPGLLLQKITTNEPDNQQLEVGIASLKAVVEKT